MDNEQHNKYLGIAFAAYSAFNILMLFLTLSGFWLFFRLGPSGSAEELFPRELFLMFFGLAAFMQIIFTVPPALASYAIFKKKSWARIAAIVAAFLSVMSMPIGTGAAIYAFWFFFGENWKPVYGVAPQHLGPATPPDPSFYENRYDSTENEYVNPPFKQPPDWR